MTEHYIDHSNENDISIPDWLTIDFVEKHLQNYFKNSEIKIKTWTIQSATAKGENFASHIYRVRIYFDGDVNAGVQVIIVMEIEQCQWRLFCNFLIGFSTLKYSHF